MTTRTTEFSFHKIIGAGNDFIVLMLDQTENSRLFQNASERAEKIQSFCDRIFGIGADGLIFLEKEIDPDTFRWHFFNRDGSSAEMCGNAARAVTRLLLELSSAKKIKVMTLETEFIGYEEGGEIVVEFQMPIEDRATEIKLQNKTVKGRWIRAGVPHFIPDENISWEEARLRSHEMPFLRHAEEHGLAGANVTLIHQLGGQPKAIRALTYERGVEGFTLACGTGAIAAAWDFAGRKGDRGRIAVQMPGGLLHVQFLENNCVRLVGEGRYVFRGLYRQEQET